MGVFSVEVKDRNWQNRFLPQDQQGEKVTRYALVDTGAANLCLPTELVEQLLLVQVGTTRVKTADGAFHNYRVVGIAEVEVKGALVSGYSD